MINLPFAPKVIESEPNKLLLEIEGLYPGYGITLGNAYRRVLLSSLSGAAATSFKIKGIEHEFSVIDHILENVVEMMLNIKNIRFKCHSDEPQKLFLKVKGEREVKAGDIEPNPLVEIVNPEARIATITDKKGELEMEITVEKGIGYSSLEERKQEKLPIGTIAIDAIFSPVKKVNFRVENMRVGKRVDFNRLIITIETDGSNTPLAAFKEANDILKQHFDLIDSWLKEETKESLKEGKILKEPKDIKIEDLDFSPRTGNALFKNNIKTLAGLLRYSEKSLSELDGLGNKAMEEIKNKLNALGYHLK